MSKLKETVYILGNLSQDFPSVFEYLSNRFALEPYPIQRLKSESPNSISSKVFLCSDSFDFDGLDLNRFKSSSALLILQKFSKQLETPFVNTQSYLVNADDKNNGVVIENNLIRVLSQCKSIHELETSNKQLKTLVYSITHDLRAPLMSLLGLIDIAKEDDTLEKREVFRLFERSIGRMDEHIKTTLDYYRNQSDAIQYKEIDVPELINGIVDMHRNYNQVVEFRTKHEGEKLACTDPLRVRIALFNLISNAIKYGNKGPGNYTVQIDSNCRKDYLEISVTDYGPGIHPDEHEKIFNLFVLESQTPKSTGLGLYLARDAMHRIGAEIHLKSQPGKGATFTLQIPLEQGTEIPIS